MKDATTIEVSKKNRGWLNNLKYKMNWKSYDEGITKIRILIESFKLKEDLKNIK